MIKAGLLPLACGGLLLLSGCASSSGGNNFVRTGDPIIDGNTAIAQGPEKDKVLWQYRTGVAAMRRGDTAEAKLMLDAAIERVSNIYSPDKSAKKARSLFSEESKKTFLGEPYERIMAYYYRGILYWMDGEPDNARACFRSAQLIDSDTENKEYSNDWVLLDYLDGFATVKMNGDGADSLKRAQDSFKIGKLPEYSKSANTVVFFEFGQGPTKYATGEYSEQLRIREGNSLVRGAWFKVDNKAVRIAPYDDLNYQARTRGGRIMDHILANKAVFKTGTDTFGNAALLSGLVVGTQRGGGEIGLGLVAAGLVGKIVAASTTPAADTRAWESLPQFLSFLTLDLPPGQHTATVEFLDGAGNPLPSMTKTFNLTVAPGKDTVLFVSDHNT
jgi:hypothetical protein